MKKIKHNVIFDSLTQEIKIPVAPTIDPVRLRLERRLRKLQQRKKKGKSAYRRILEIKDKLHIPITDEERCVIEKLFKKYPAPLIIKNRRKIREVKRRKSVLNDLHSPEVQKATIERERIRLERLGISAIDQEIINERHKKEAERQCLMLSLRKEKFSKGRGNGPTLLSIKF